MRSTNATTIASEIRPTANEASDAQLAQQRRLHGRTHAERDACATPQHGRGTWHMYGFSVSFGFFGIAGIFRTASRAIDGRPQSQIRSGDGKQKADQRDRRTCDAQRGNRLRGSAEPAESVDQQAHDDLPGDWHDHGFETAQFRQQQHIAGQESDTEHAREPHPPWAVRRGGGNQRIRAKQQRQSQHRNEADAERHQRGAQRRADGTAEPRVHRGLHRRDQSGENSQQSLQHVQPSYVSRHTLPGTDYHGTRPSADVTINP